jgi:hypothetical protein
MYHFASANTASSAYQLATAAAPPSPSDTQAAFTHCSTFSPVNQTCSQTFAIHMAGSPTTAATSSHTIRPVDTAF